jgi:hypothetical protein
VKTSLSQGDRCWAAGNHKGHEGYKGKGVYGLPFVSFVLTDEAVHNRAGKLPMTVDRWLEAAKTDADRRSLPALKPLLETLARMTKALRAADFNERADGVSS